MVCTLVDHVLYGFSCRWLLIWWVHTHTFVPFYCTLSLCRTATALAIGARQPSALSSPAKLGPDAVLPLPAGGQPLQVAWLAGGTSLSGRYVNLSPFMHQAPVSIRCVVGSDFVAYMM